MVPIELEKFVSQFLNGNPGENKKDIRRKLVAAVEAKQNGAACINCGNPIWAIGSAVSEWNGCFTCV